MANQQGVNYQITGQNLLSGVLRQIDRDAQQASNSVNGISGSNGSSSGGGLMRSIVGANLLTSAIRGSASAVLDFAKDSFQAYGKQEQFLVSLKTMFHGNAAEAENLNSKLQDFAKQTPFELTEIQDATKMMIAYGSTSGGVVKELNMLGDVGSGVGSSLSEIGYLYGTLRTQGRAFSKDIYQFTGRGIPIVRELAKQFGVTDDKVMKMVEDGKVGFKEVEKAFQSMTSEGGQFFGMMKEQSKTQLGQLSNLQDGWTQLKVNIGENFADAAKSSFASLTEVLNDMNNALIFLNKSSKTFNNSGVGYRASEMLNYGEKVGYAENEVYLKQIVDKGAEGGQKEKWAKGVLQNLAQSVTTDYNLSVQSGKTKDDNGFHSQQYLRKIAQINSSLSSLGSISKEKSSNAAAAAAAASEVKKEKLGTGVTIESQAPKNQYITINGGLVNQMTIQSMDGNTPAPQIKEKISTVLVELLNDSYQAMR